MTVVDVNTGKFTGQGGNLEETVTRNNLEAAEEIVRQLRLRDVGGIVVIDFIDMVLESNRELVLRRLLECLARDRTKHQVAEVTSLGLVQMTRKRVGAGLLEAFSTPCECCNGRGVILTFDPDSDRPRRRARTRTARGQRRQRRPRQRPGNGGQRQRRSRQRRPRSPARPRSPPAPAPPSPPPAPAAAERRRRPTSPPTAAPPRRHRRRPRRRRRAPRAGSPPRPPPTLRPRLTRQPGRRAIASAGLGSGGCSGLGGQRPAGRRPASPAGQRPGRRTPRLSPRPLRQRPPPPPQARRRHGPGSLSRADQPRGTGSLRPLRARRTSESPRPPRTPSPSRRRADSAPSGRRTASAAAIRTPPRRRRRRATTPATGHRQRRGADQASSRACTTGARVHVRCLRRSPEPRR